MERGDLGSPLACLLPTLTHNTAWCLELPDTLAESCMQDSKGDNLDAVLCALQAAWAFTQHDDGYGIPSKSHSLEGWIVDPGLLSCEQSNQYSQNPNQCQTPTNNRRKGRNFVEQ